MIVAAHDLKLTGPGFGCEPLPAASPRNPQMDSTTCFFPSPRPRTATGAGLRLALPHHGHVWDFFGARRHGYGS